jgi:hypothetical protein
MAIKIVKEGTLWTAEVTPPHGQWRSPNPMGIGHLVEALKSGGYSKAEIDNAVKEAASIQSQLHWDKDIGQRLRSALAGEYEVPPQDPFTEPWVAYSLFLGQGPLRLGEMVFKADDINRQVINADEIAWAFIRLRKRKWLAEAGNTFGLTRRGRLSMRIIMRRGGRWQQIERLENWMRNHPPGGN